MSATDEGPIFRGTIREAVQMLDCWFGVLPDGRKVEAAGVIPAGLVEFRQPDPEASGLYCVERKTMDEMRAEMEVMREKFAKEAAERERKAAERKRMKAEREAKAIASGKPPPGPERNAAICAARQEGRTLRSIADEFGLSLDRVRMIAWREEKRALHGEPELSPRAFNVIRNSIADDMATNECRDDFADPSAVAKLVAEAGRGSFEGAGNCGKVTMAQIEAWMARYGFYWEATKAEKLSRAETIAEAIRFLEGPEDLPRWLRKFLVEILRE
jgi:hypothetical protein